MSDIGRAKTCEKAIEEAKASPWHSSCLAAHVTAVQARFCSPMIDCRGDFHASESGLCQSFGNVNRDDGQTMFDNLKAGRPCGGCIPCKRYLTEDNEKMIKVRELLGQKKEGES